jgi:hypothetical protein
MNMFRQSNISHIVLSSMLGLVLCAGCQGWDPDGVGVGQFGIVDVPHTAVERQSIGNCWLYAQASWVEAIHLAHQLDGGGGGGGGPVTQTLLDKQGESVADNETKPYTVTIPDNGTKLTVTMKDLSGDPDLKITVGSKECYPYKDGDERCEFTDPPAGEVTLEIIGYQAGTYDLKVVFEGTAGGGGGGGTPPEELDVSQSYWTYWHWFDQVTGYMYKDEISTGGNQWKSHAIVRDRGLMLEVDFVPADATSEMSSRQSSAKSKINIALKSGALSTSEARRDGEKVRQVFDDAWGLSQEVRDQLDKAFGKDGEMTLRTGGDLTGTKILDPNKVNVKYAERKSDETVVYLKKSLVDAVKSWQQARYPSSASSRRSFLQRVQRALHARQPVVITWDVDFNALENNDEERGGSFNMQTLQDAGRPGRQGGHMTVLEDYAAITAEFGLVEAAVTLDPSDPQDAAKLKALMREDTQITLLRTKNSWGANRPDRQFAKGFPGYHDLWMDYLNGPIKFCPDVDNKTEENCRGETNPLRNVMLPPGY